MRRWNLRRLVLKLHLLLAIAAAGGLSHRPVNAGTQLEDLAIRAGFRIVSAGDSSSESQKQASSQIPLRLMTAANRQRAVQVIEKCGQFRKLPELQYSVDPIIYRYLLEHPDVAVSTWRVMGISQFEMWQTGPLEYEARATDGSEGIADILYRDERQCVFICDGRYHNPLLPRPLEAVALIWFRSTFVPGSDGAYVVSQKADVFVSFGSTGLSTFAKILTPVTNSLMDRNLYEVSLYASLMSRAVRDEPEWIIQVAQQMDGVLPQRNNELIQIARQPRRPSMLPANTSRNPQGERQRLMDSGITLFGPPTGQDLKLNEELAAVPKAPAPKVPQVPAKTGAQSAASSSLSAPSATAPAAHAKAAPRLLFISRDAGAPELSAEKMPPAATSDADTNVRPGPVRTASVTTPSMPMADFSLQPSVLPPKSFVTDEPQPQGKAETPPATASESPATSPQ